jgi:hypothetical protein
LCSEVSGVAPYDTGHLTTAIIQRAVEGEEYIANLATEGVAGETEKDQEDGKTPFHYPSSVREEGNVYQRYQFVKEEPSERKDKDDGNEGKKGTLQLTVRTVIQAMLPKTNPLTERHYGVRQPGGVTEEEVKEPTAEKGDYGKIEILKH